MAKKERRSLFDMIFSKKSVKIANNQNDGYFKLLNSYTPSFTSFQGKVYESELVRSAINAVATQFSKLAIDFTGSAQKSLTSLISRNPNKMQTASQFLYRVATILEVNNTCFIVPIEDDAGKMTGIYPVLPNTTEIIENAGIPYLRFNFLGNRAAMELDRVGILTKFQYSSDVYGESNSAIRQILEVQNMQNQSIVEGMKNSFSFRFLAKYGVPLKPEDLAKQRKELMKVNYDADNNGGIMIFNSQYQDIKQIDSKPFIVDPQQKKAIDENVYSYFGVSEKIMQNSYDEDEWNAFYEGRIEPLAIQLSEVLTKMIFSERERAQGNSCILTANRLQYSSARTKLAFASQMLDRGVVSINQVLDVFNLPHVENGDVRIVRKEYEGIESYLEGGTTDDNS